MTDRRLGGKARAAAMVGGLASLLTCMALVCLISTLVWPGQARYVGGLSCDDAHPDVVVVKDTRETTDGTTVDFTVYCVSPGGDAIDAGWARAFLALWGIYSAVALVLVVGAGVRHRRRHRRRDRDQVVLPPTSTTSPPSG